MADRPHHAFLKPPISAGEAAAEDPMTIASKWRALDMTNPPPWGFAGGTRY
jgi:hypothetical protein